MHRGDCVESSTVEASYEPLNVIVERDTIGQGRGSGEKTERTDQLPSADAAGSLTAGTDHAGRSRRMRPPTVRPLVPRTRAITETMLGA